MFMINDRLFYKQKGKRKEKCRVIGCEYYDKMIKYIVELKDERVIEGVTFYELSIY